MEPWTWSVDGNGEYWLALPMWIHDAAIILLWVWVDLTLSTIIGPKQRK